MFPKLALPTDVKLFEDQGNSDVTCWPHVPVFLPFANPILFMLFPLLTDVKLFEDQGNSDVTCWPHVPVFLPFANPILFMLFPLLTDVKLFEDQGNSDAILDDLACMLGCTRSSLHGGRVIRLPAVGCTVSCCRWESPKP